MALSLNKKGNVTFPEISSPASQVFLWIKSSELFLMDRVDLGEII